MFRLSTTLARGVQQRGGVLQRSAIVQSRRSLVTKFSKVRSACERCQRQRD